MKSRLTMPRVASVRGRCRLTTSASASSSKSSIRSILCRWSKSASTTVSNATTLIPKLRAHGDGAADTSHANQAHGPASDRRDQGDPSRQNGSRDRYVSRRLARAKQERHGLFGDAVVIGSRSDRHGNFVRGRGREVDQVIADAGARNGPETGSQGEKLARHAFAAGEHRVDFAEVGKQLRFGQREAPSGSTGSKPASVRICRNRPD